MPEVKCPECGKLFDFDCPFPPALLGKIKPVCPKCLRKAQTQENIAPKYTGSGNKSRNIHEKVEGDNSWKAEQPHYK